MSAAGAAAAVSALLVIASGGGLGHTLSQGLAAVARADRRWLFVAFAGFLGSLVATAGGWRATLGACGGRIGRVDACARYGVGSLVNTLLPARLGEAVRVGLFSQAFPRERRGRTLTTVGALGAVTAADTLTQSGVVASAAGIGPVPLWSLGAVAGFVAGAAGLALLAARRFRSGRPAQLLGVFRELAGSPGRAVTVFLWLGAATVARLVAAMAIAAALALPHPVEAGVVMCAVVIVATALPLTPGNLGVTTGAIVLALHSQGVPIASAVAAGLAFHAVELLAGVVFGAAGVLALVPMRAPMIRRRVLALTTLVTAALLAVGVGATFLPQLT